MHKKISSKMLWSYRLCRGNEKTGSGIWYEVYLFTTVMSILSSVGENKIEFTYYFVLKGFLEWHTTSMTEVPSVHLEPRNCWKSYMVYMSSDAGMSYFSSSFCFFHFSCAQELMIQARYAATNPTEKGHAKGQQIRWVIELFYLAFVLPLATCSA